MNKSFLGRCDICGGTLDATSDDKIVIADEDGFKEEAMRVDIDVGDVIEGIAMALERTESNPFDDILAESLRNQHGYKIHKRCEKKTSLQQFSDAHDQMVQRGIIEEAASKD